MTIHHIDMYGIGATSLCGSNGSTQFRKVSRQN
jgi:hypothetical protein